MPGGWLSRLSADAIIGTAKSLILDVFLRKFIRCVAKPKGTGFRDWVAAMKLKGDSQLAAR